MLCLLPAVPQAASLYLCKAYSGGTFWSVESCQTKQALIDRIVSVPDGLSFDEQVRLGEQARAEGDRLRQPDSGSGHSAATPKHSAAHRADHPTNKQAACAALATRVNKLDAQARQPQSGRAQDRITAQKHKLRERQAELRC
jgi:hypothetical protein